jgi:hypothetical protein
METALEAVIWVSRVVECDDGLVASRDSGGSRAFGSHDQTDVERRHDPAAKLRNFGERVRPAAGVSNSQCVTLADGEEPGVDSPGWMADDRGLQR